MTLVQPLFEEVVMEERGENFSNDARQLKLVGDDLTQLSLAELATAINQSHSACQEKYKASLIDARKAGESLLIAKTKVKQSPSGRWLVWVSENCPDIPKRTAQAYMQIAREWEVIEKSASLALFGLEDALKLLAQSKKATTPAKEKKQPSCNPAQTTDNSSDVIDADNLTSVNSVMDAELTESEVQGDQPTPTTLIEESNTQDKTLESETEEQQMIPDADQVDNVAPYTKQSTVATTADTASLTYKHSTVVTTEVTIELIRNADVFSDEQVRAIFDALCSRFKRIGVFG